MKSTVILMGLVIVALILVSCHAPPKITPTGIELTGYGGVAEIQEFALKDGTRCAAIVGDSMSLSCNWSSETMKPLCIYHGNCADGFGAAWVFKRHARREFDFYAGVYQNEPPDVEGREVYLVDFSYKRAVVEQLCEKATRVVLIDHHKTAIEDLKPLIESARIEALVNLEKSGAILAWEWLHGDREPPQLLRHIEDRDLWRFALPGTREIQANVFSHPYDFAVWDALMERPVEELIAEGRAIERKHFKDIGELLGVVTRRMVIAGHNVPVANLPYTLTSDAGHQLAAKGEPFAGCYWDTPQGRVFSLRSTDDGLDVSEIAKQYGGGGHRNASGFRVSYEAAKAFEVAS